MAVSLPLPFFTPTRAFPIPFIARWPLGGTANRLSYQFNRFTALAYGGMINTFRRHTLGLAPLSRWSDYLTLPTAARSRPLRLQLRPSSRSRPTTRRMPTSPATGSCPTRRPGSRRHELQSTSWPPANRRSTSASAAWASARTPPHAAPPSSTPSAESGPSRRRHRLGRHRPSRQLATDVLVVDDIPHDWLFPADRRRRPPRRRRHHRRRPARRPPHPDLSRPGRSGLLGRPRPASESAQPRCPSGGSAPTTDATADPARGQDQPPRTRRAPRTAAAIRDRCGTSSEDPARPEISRRRTHPTGPHPTRPAHRSWPRASPPDTDSPADSRGHGRAGVDAREQPAMTALRGHRLLASGRPARLTTPAVKAGLHGAPGSLVGTPLSDPLL